MPWRQLLPMVVVANVASALVGLVVTWPVMYSHAGVSFLIENVPWILAMAFVTALVLGINVVIEYSVSVRGWVVARGRRVVLGFIVANMLSLVMLVVTGSTRLRL